MSRYFYYVVTCIFACFLLSSCDYEAESLPGIKTDYYTVAFPIGDTVYSFDNLFDDFPESIQEGVIPPMVFVDKSVSYTVYMQEIQDEENYLMEWIEPKFIMNNTLGSKFNIAFTSYFITWDLVPYYLVNRQQITTNKATLMGTERDRIGPAVFPAFNDIEQVVCMLHIELKEPVTIEELKNATIRIQIAAKARFKIGGAS